MDTLLLFFLGVLAAALIVLTAWIWRLVRHLRDQTPPDPGSGLLVLQNQVDALREQVRVSLESGRSEIDRRLEETNRVVGEVRRGLGSVDQQVRSMTDAARDLRGLQDLMRSPKLRGGMGETLLADLLGQVLPRAHFALQYEFPGGTRVDAVLHVGERMVPVDAKFPLENFRRMRGAAADEDERAQRDGRRAFRADVRRHIDAIATRYIHPGQGTYEFALMYIPAEAVYQEMLAQEGDDGLDLFHYALNRQVVPVSPQSFYAYLQVILLGLRGLSIESRAREIMTRLGLIQSRLDRFTESFDVAARHLGHAQSQMEEAARRLARLEAAFGELAGTRVENPDTAEDAAREGQKRIDTPA